jgi:malate synthase
MAIRYRSRSGLEVAEPLCDFVEGGVAQAVGLQPEKLWEGLAKLLADLAPLNRQLLARRDSLQSQIDHWYRQRGAPALQVDEQETFLRQIGYLVPQGPPFQIGTGRIDAEIATIAGPQLVVPLSIPRYALNAANARWGSLYDALYGTDAIPDDGGASRGQKYNPLRGAAVIAFGRRFLDQSWPLQAGSHADASAYALSGAQLQVTMQDGKRTSLADGNGLVGFRGSREAPDAIVLRRHGLHAEILIDRAHEVGRNDAAGIADLQLESAITVIMDMEDSVAAVDAMDKVALYRNWLGLITGDLTAEMTKGGHSISRHLNADREFTKPDSSPGRLPGRSLMLIRNVGHLMSSDMVRIGGTEAPEGILDALFSSLVGMHDLQGKGRYRNSSTGSIYIVKPKMHGPEEAAFANQMFDRVEDLLGLPRHTVKIGVMDEERRTSVNLAECVRAVKDRIIFINTGFLDRTGDEIHTAMQAGPVMRKGDMKGAAWLKAYEENNVQVGLACGFTGRAQIGKGMWAMPDKMADMLATKGTHPQAGASTAWVPSPTAATLHALHYHQVDVAARQAQLRTQAATSARLMLQVPVVANPQWTESQIREELENNSQGILGYVVRWIEQGIGCSKVPDIHDVGLMEDRATLRISSQHIANWLLHGIVQADQVRSVLTRMAAIVDRQNGADPGYRPMATDLKHSAAFSAASDLIFKGTGQPNGYTEPLLHAYRRALKGL